MVSSTFGPHSRGLSTMTPTLSQVSSAKNFGAMRSKQASIRLISLVDIGGESKDIFLMKFDFWISRKKLFLLSSSSAATLPICNCLFFIQDVHITLRENGTFGTFLKIFYTHIFLYVSVFVTTLLA